LYRAIAMTARRQRHAIAVAVASANTTKGVNGMLMIRFLGSLVGRDRETARGDADAAAAWFDDFRPVVPRSWRTEDNAPVEPAAQSTYVPRAYCG
jgi:hypothetical protein